MGFVAGPPTRGFFTRDMENGGVQERALAEKYTGWAHYQRSRGYLFVSRCLKDIASSYGEYATFEDTLAKLWQRGVHMG